VEENLNNNIPQEPQGFVSKQSKFNLKRFYGLNILKILTVLVVALAIPLTVVSLQKPQNIKQNASSGAVEKEVLGNADSNGYIVVLKSSSNIKSTNTIQSFRSNESALRSDREAFKTMALSLLKKKEVVNDSTANINPKKNLFVSNEELKVNEEYENVFNGFALDISENEAEQIKQLPAVESVYKNLTAKTNLYQSVPLIHADSVWNYSDASGHKINGKGVNVAVIDTGVDYTHPSLGKTKITERKLIQASNFNYENELKGREYYLLAAQAYDFSFKKLIYISGIDKINIFDFDTKKTRSIVLHTPGLNNPLLNKLQWKGDNIVYFAADDKSGGLYLYKLSTGKSKKVADVTAKGGNIAFFENFYLTSDNKLVFLDNLKFTYEVATIALKVLNLNSGDTKVLAKFDNDNLITYFAKGSDDSIAYSVSSMSTKTCNPSRMIVQNINTGDKKVINVSHLGELNDYKGNLLLYSAPCKELKTAPDTYYLYNLDTKKETKINIGKDTSSDFSVQSSSLPFQVGYVDTPIARIGKDAIFFIKYGASKLWAYDLNKKIFNKISLFKYANSIEVNGNRVCFIDSNYDDNQIFCHDYDTNLSYKIPNIFNSKVVGGFNFVSTDPDPMDDEGHGTHVANIIAGNGSPKGVAPGANIIAYKVLNSNGSGSISKIIKAIDAAIKTRLDGNPDNDITVINMSLGMDCNDGYEKDCGPDDPMSKAVDRATDYGITVVVAAGNSGPKAKTVSSPGTARKAITVGAVDKSKKIAEFSARGPVVWNGETLHKPDILAPGVDICSAKAFVVTWKNCNSLYPGNWAISGTSMASPHIAGVVALLHQANPTLNPLQIKQRLKMSTENLNYERDTQGSGLINLNSESFTSALTNNSIEHSTILTPTPTDR